jgi:Spy/CpxP family protein refolding chaperone
MRLTFCLLCVAVATALLTPAVAAPPAGNPIDALLYQPGDVLKHRELLALTDGQVEKIEAEIRKATPVAQDLQKKANQAMGKLAELLMADSVDEDAAVQLLDESLITEKEQKRLHLRVMIRVRNILTNDQRQTAMKLQRAASSQQELQHRLKTKIEMIQKEIQRRAESGNPPSDVVGLMQKFPELMKKGQPLVAEAILDRVIAMLSGQDQGKNADGAPGRPDGNRPSPTLPGKVQRLQQLAKELQQNGGDVSKVGRLMEKLGPLMQKGNFKEVEKLIDESKLLGDDKPAPKGNAKAADKEEARRLPESGLIEQSSIDEVRAKVAAMKVKDVEWRKIAWKTCLLDGLKASREEQKPIMLWIFIDRPIDDERC